jgi:hypothetical protein
MDLVRSLVSLGPLELLGLEPLELLVDPRHQRLQNLERPKNQMTLGERRDFALPCPLGFRYPN